MAPELNSLVRKDKLHISVGLPHRTLHLANLSTSTTLVVCLPLIDSPAFLAVILTLLPLWWFDARRRFFSLIHCMATLEYIEAKIMCL